MSGQNIKNYYFNRFDARLSEIGNYDITLSSDYDGFDSEVVYSNQLVGEENGNILPVNIDLNSVLSNQKDVLLWNSYYSGNTLISKNYYNPNNEDLSCKTATTLCDIGLTATDNGLYSKMTGETITFTMGINDFEKFNPHYYDRRFKMHPVTGYTNSPNHRFSGNTKQTVYNIVSKTGDTVGYYNELYGGFYQGFYKLSGYDYEVLPERFNKGWTTEFLLKPRKTDEHTISSNQTYLNDVYPDNSGTFFFMGARSENKYYHPASGSPVSDSGYTRVTSGLTNCIKTCSCADTGVTNSECITVYPQTATTQVHRTGGCGTTTQKESVPLDSPDLDLFSNALSFRLSGDPENPKICVKYIKFTGDCITTGTCENTGLTYSSGYTIVETCSSKGIYDDCNYELCPSGTSEQWVMISAVFSRYNSFADSCDLLNKGGLGDVRQLLYPSEVNGASPNIIMPPHTHPGSVSEKLRNYININQKWFDQYLDRLGNLYIYVNGYRFMTINDFEEIIPHELNTEKEKQLGVPFNISLGGGTQGLRESLVFSGCSGLTGPYIQDPELMPNQTLSGTSLSGLTTDIVMEPTFGGTFMGAISQFRMYVEPLSAPQIQHNFRLLKDRFGLYDFWCPECESCLISPTVTPSTTTTPTITTTPSSSITPSTTTTPSISVSTTPTVTPSTTTTPTITTTPSSSITPSTTTTPSISVSTTPTVTPSTTTTPTTTPSISVSTTPSVTPTISISSTPTVTPSLTNTPSVTTTPSLTQTLTPTPSTTWIGVQMRDCCTNEFVGSFNVPSDSVVGESIFYGGSCIYYSVTLGSAGPLNPYLNLNYDDCDACEVDHPCPTPTPTTTPSISVSTTPSVTPTVTPSVTNTPTPSSSETFFILFENSDIMTSENGDGIEYEHHISPSVTPTQTQTPSVTTTSTITPTPTPSITSTITPTPSVTPINPVSGMLFYYDPGNTSSYNGSGTVLSDLSGNGNDATIFGGPSYTSGNGGYFSFDGTDDHILSPNIYDGSNENHTVEVWVYLTSVNECLWSDNGQSTPLGGYHFAGSQVLQVGPFQQVISALWGGTATSRGVNGSGSLLNGWNQVVRVYNGTTITPYLNGVVGSTETVSFDSPYDDGLTDWYLAFGHEDTTTYNGTAANFFSGRYGVIRYYNTTLNSSQILQNFNSDRSKYGL